MTSSLASIRLGSFQESERNRPDVILIGVDSVRVDHIGFLNGLGEQSLTPNIDQLLRGAAVIDNAWTPLARTFPAWLSILTGQYPGTHGGYFNLMARHRVNDHASFAHQLGDLGYQRIYGIDETRFSNIDASYGFDQVVTPAIGAADFVLETISDLPGVNLLAGTSIGGFLFPSLHMNRAYSTIYNPEVFDRNLGKSLRDLDPDRPLFLAAHFELPHYPYTWHQSNRLVFDSPTNLDDISPEPYRAAVARVDQQVAALISSLEEAGRLDHAILVLLSDHGEAFTDSEPEWIPIGNVHRSVPSDGWHGTNVLSEAQYRVMLAFRGYGVQQLITQPTRHSEVMVSHIDIRPTLQEWLGIPAPPEMSLDGISLLPVLAAQSESTILKRTVSVETGFSVPSMKNKYADREEIAKEGAEYYTVDRIGRLELKESMIPLILADKQRAAICDDWVLGAYPGQTRQDNWDLLLANLSTHHYWDGRDRENIPADAPLQDLFSKICRQFDVLATSLINPIPECSQN